MKQGNIIFLNGTSSSGKTTLAKTLQQVLEEPYVYMSCDEISGVDAWYHQNLEARVNQFPPNNIVFGFYRAVAGYTQAGVGVLLDHVTEWDTGMRECIELFRNTRVLWVEVVCPVEVLREREKARGDRKVGQAESQIPGLASFRRRFPYDLQVDTSLHTPEECARLVIAVLNDSTVKTSFEKMRECKAGEPPAGGDGKPAPQP